MLNNNLQSDSNGMTCFWVRSGVLDMRIKTKITASHTLNEKTNKQTNKQETTTTTIALTTRTTWKYSKWSKSFWEQFVLTFSKTADCIGPRAHAFFLSLAIHAQLCISKNRSFFLVFSKSLAHGKKKKSYIVFSFDLNLKDNVEQTDTTPSTQLEKSKKKDQ